MFSQCLVRASFYEELYKGFNTTPPIPLPELKPNYNFPIRTSMTLPSPLKLAKEQKKPIKGKHFFRNGNIRYNMMVNTEMQIEVLDFFFCKSSPFSLEPYPKGRFTFWIATGIKSAMVGCYTVPSY